MDIKDSHLEVVRSVFRYGPLVGLDETKRFKLAGIRLGKHFKITGSNLRKYTLFRAYNRWRITYTNGWTPSIDPPKLITFDGDYAQFEQDVLVLKLAL